MVSSVCANSGSAGMIWKGPCLHGADIEPDLAYITLVKATRNQRLVSTLLAPQ
ncbi:hypothetical protein M378DRAFT_165617 [Amanita muscaria Koide BX008]|uniref:Uncharacterized protein n=1 Tax=Amanita muscaria (strain Koide BX008) TaxID=946122 RepID=A0A0C2T7L3_AMAMK|nr:hypothetical protein M378DRAFT_165617 [Amanita muscaria Koide BX008]